MTLGGRRSAVCLLLLGLLCAGCSSPSSYWRSRGADLLDVVPMSIGFGWGIGVSAQATPLLQVGLSVTPTASSRVGYDDRYVHGKWDEFQAGMPWSFFVGSWNQSVRDHPWLLFVDISELPPQPASVPWYSRGVPLLYRWQRERHGVIGVGHRDTQFEGHTSTYYEPNVIDHGRHPPLVRESQGALIWPQTRRWLEFHDLRLEQGDPDLTASLGSPDRATLWRTYREGVPASRAWDLFELDGFLGIVGVRIGVRPLEFVDFVLGILFLDPLLDDIPAPETFEPSPWPPPAEAGAPDAGTESSPALDDGAPDVDAPADDDAAA